MRFLSHSANKTEERGKAGPAETPVCYESVLKIESTTTPGVSFVVNRISFGRRMELSRRVRELTQKSQFLEAGSEASDKIEAGILALEVDAMYLRWALARVDGLKIDGETATVDQMIERGPDDLTREIVDAIKRQCGLSESERKN